MGMIPWRSLMPWEKYIKYEKEKGETHIHHKYIRYITINLLFTKPESFMLNYIGTK